MKNFNRCSSPGHHGSKCCELAQHAHSRGSHAYTHTNTVTTTLREALAQLLQNLDSNFILKVPEGGGANQSTRRKNPDSLPTNRYYILEEKIQHPSLSPPNIGD